MPSNWGEFLYRTKIGGNNPTVENYARANGLSYEEAAWYMYQSGQAGETSPDYPRTGATGPGGTATIKFEEYIEPAEKMIAPYYDQLLLDAKGDWELVKKYLIQDFEFYLGQGDDRMAAFLKSVANDVEKRQGTIQFDYEQAKRRKEEDYVTKMARAAEGEKTWREEEAFGAEKAQRERTGGYLERLGGAGTLAHGVIGEAEKEAEKERQFKIDAYNRYLKNLREDLLKEKERGLEDITTEARRKIFAAQTYGPGGEIYEKKLREFEELTRPKTGEIAKQRQEARQMYLNWLASSQIKSVEPFL